ncbi:MAG TPA: A/G-specific adenine glycosylase [Caulobacteraceae bacterium]|jgi:A/G-specific adenine glycosylase|nr:A/G-specific adenine glycosylase [Caulobacteraceae bacterium]
MSFVAPLRSRLLEWYDRHARTLPWRAPRGGRADPYRVWLSEVMLQQTTTVHAAPYYEAFLRRWPTVTALAAAEDAEVMSAWAGLGYYARARNLLACARAVARDHDGRFPDTEEGLRVLPGLGPYTAAAVAAIAFDRPANVVDGNVERVMARLFAVEAPLPDAKPELKRLAASLVTAQRPGDWAQALMDLGAVICRPRSPLCEACPISGDCRAFAAGAPEGWPRRKARAERPRRHGVAFVLLSQGQVALEQRPASGLLGGMLGLPTTPWRAEPWTLAEAHGAAPGTTSWTEAGAVEHVFTHFALRLTVLTCAPAEPAAGFLWTPVERARSGLPTVFRKAVDLAAPAEPQLI